MRSVVIGQFSGIVLGMQEMLNSTEFFLIIFSLPQRPSHNCSRLSNTYFISWQM